MAEEMNIGAASRLTGLSAKAIRFYEAEGLLPAPRRSEAGYRRFASEDLRRLRLVRQLRLVGMPLAEAKALVGKALGADCATFAAELSVAFAQQKTVVEQRIAELEELRRELDLLSEQVEQCECEPGQTIAACDCCPILDEEGGEGDGYA